MNWDLYNKTWCNSGIIQVIIFLFELNKDLWNLILVNGQDYMFRGRTFT